MLPSDSATAPTIPVLTVTVLTVTVHAPARDIQFFDVAIVKPVSVISAIRDVVNLIRVMFCPSATMTPG